PGGRQADYRDRAERGSRSVEGRRPRADQEGGGGSPEGLAQAGRGDVSGGTGQVTAVRNSWRRDRRWPRRRPEGRCSRRRVRRPRREEGQVGSTLPGGRR